MCVDVCRGVGVGFGIWPLCSTTGAKERVKVTHFVLGGNVQRFPVKSLYT